MTQTELDEATPKVEEKKESKNRVAELLQAPRRKRKSYVFLALGKGVPTDIASGLDQLIRTNFKQLGISRAGSLEDLKKGFSRQISLLIFDDEFLPLVDGLNLVSEMKRRLNEDAVPVLFLTRDPTRLIQAYNQVLAPFHETDDYVEFASLSNAEILSRVRYAITSSNRRRSRRYKVNIPLRYSLLGEEQMLNGRIFDLSVHGAYLRDEDGRMFQPGEQLRLRIPLGKSAPLADGEYLKLSARVRRIFMVGSEAGVSFEHTTEEKSLALTKLITSLANVQNMRRG
jgi:hypothetical protein